MIAPQKHRDLGTKLVIILLAIVVLSLVLMIKKADKPCIPQDIYDHRGSQ